MPATPGSRRAAVPGQAGFTMIEVMIAIVLTALGTSGVVALFMVETRASSFSRHGTEAGVLAQDEIELLRTTLAPAQASTGTQTAINETGIAVTAGLFTRSWTVTPSTSYDDVVVTVAWTEDGTPRQIVLRSRRNR